MARAEQQADIGAQLLRRQAISRLLGTHQFGREIVLGFAPAQLAELVEIGIAHLGARIGLLQLLAAHRHGIEDAAAHVAAHQESRAMVLRDSQHVANHDHRQAMGDVADHIHLTLVGHPVELLVDQFADSHPHVGDAPRGEGLGHQAAQARMVRRIDHQHGLRQVGDRRLLHAVGTVLSLDVARKILAESAIAQGRGDVLVSAQQPEAHRRLEHRRGLAQAVIERIGIGDEGRIERIEGYGIASRGWRGHVVHGPSLARTPLPRERATP